jgi:hypothetical protein
MAFKLKDVGSKFWHLDDLVKNLGNVRGINGRRFL